MEKLRTWVLVVPLLLPAPSIAAAEEAAGPDEAALAAEIDRQVAAGWARAGVEPAPPADDAEFLRRVCLDLTGRIPAVSEARAFLADRSPDKRARLVERLLDNPRYVEHFTNVWRALLLPEANTSIQTRVLAPGFEAWLRKRLAENTGYDRLVRELLTASAGKNPTARFYGGNPGEPNPLAFYLAKDSKPENLAASTARLFLGVRLECAQCHHHPFASWKREQFWSLAAFFAGLEPRRPGEGAIAISANGRRHELAIPGTDRTVQAAFLDGTRPRWDGQDDPQTVLANWLTAANNPYFARAAVNRLWAHFFGTGIIDPVDDMAGGETATGHPELLDALARAFVARHYDLKFLMRAVTASRIYQLGSRMTHSGQEDPHLFARMAVRGLSPEQLFDSLAQATGYQEPPAASPRRFKFPGGENARAEFLSKFADAGEKPIETSTSILQALALMNGKVVADATALERGETLAAVADAPFLDTDGRIEALYLAALSRQPSARERARMTKYVRDAGPEKEAHALADVFWVLLNSAEFHLNH